MSDDDVMFELQTSVVNAGEEYIDRVTLSKQLVINKQSIGDAEISCVYFSVVFSRCLRLF